MSTYCARSNIEAVFGVTNIADWADLDNDLDATKITARITVAISVVSAEIDDIFRRTSYKVPLINESDNTPTTIENLSATMAGLWLYEAGGGVNDVDNNGQPIHRLSDMRNWVSNMIKEIAEGRRKVDALQ